MSINELFVELAEVLDKTQPIELEARNALIENAYSAKQPEHWTPLPQEIQDVLLADDALPVCRMIADLRLPWAPPQTSDDPRYVEHSKPKVAVELLGPEGLVFCDSVRLGLYGMLPEFEYGIRTHPAEETFVMLAGQAYWKRGDADYVPKQAGERSYHPSMLPHANKTGKIAFMSIYIWRGDVSTERYIYQGIPDSQE